MINWVLAEADDDLLAGRRTLTDDELMLLLPARETRGAARRITLSIRIADGRRARRFDAVGNVAQLRMQFRDRSVFLAVGPPQRSEPAISSPRALDLMAAVRRCVPVAYIGSARDAGSAGFEAAFRRAIRGALRERLVHHGRGGAPADYRRVRQALQEIDALASTRVAALWDAISGELPAGLAREGRIDVQVTADRLIDWLTDRAELLISTGDHDSRMVPPAEVGSGLQSLLLMQLLTREMSSSGASMLLLEEPESFLHPSAQRALARSLFDAQRVKLILSTHSTVVVDESVAADVVLVKDHKIFSPGDVDETRRQINSALLTGQGSEAIFSRSVLLVEGPGDRAFFETLRRRLSSLLPASVVGNLGVVAVGGKQRFGPWVQLLQNYVDKHSGIAPIDFLVVADGVDASMDIVRGLREGGVVIPSELERRLRLVSGFHASGDVASGIRATRQFNSQAENRNGLPSVLLPVDLEYSALASASPLSIATLCESLNTPVVAREDLMRHLGSKFGGTASSSAVKHDWIRAEIASTLPWREVTPEVRRVLRRWVAPALTAGTPMPAVIRRPRLTVPRSVVSRARP